jgi:hypothetical protein
VASPTRRGQRFGGAGAPPSARALKAEEGGGGGAVCGGAVVRPGATRGEAASVQADLDPFRAGHEARRRWASGSRGGA